MAIPEGSDSAMCMIMSINPQLIAGMLYRTFKLQASRFNVAGAKIATFVGGQIRAHF